MDIESALGISAKIEVKTEIPTASSGRLVDALTDIIRPVSESLGLLGDKIQLSRQKTLTQIVYLARERIELLNKPTNEVPNKFFLPLLEKASLED